LGTCGEAIEEAPAVCDFILQDCSQTASSALQEALQPLETLSNSTQDPGTDTKLSDARGPEDDLLKPDLSVSLDQPVYIAVDSVIEVGITVENTGEPTVSEFAILLDVLEISISETRLAPPLDAGASWSSTLRLEVPMGVHAIQARVDGADAVLETTEANNVQESLVVNGIDAGAAIPGGWTWGTSGTLLLTRRPMLITALERRPGLLELGFNDSDHTGQDFLVKKSWLQSYDIDAPVFSYQTGDSIPFDDVGDYYRVRPPHFSIILAQDADMGLFETLSPQPFSSITYNLDHTIVIDADSRDAADP
jgi:hypothetical protein